MPRACCSGRRPERRLSSANRVDVKRVDRHRWERRRRALLIVGLSFALGALSAVALTWRLAESEPPTQMLSPTAAEIAQLEAVAASHDELPVAQLQQASRTAAPRPTATPAPAATSGSDTDGSDVDTLRRRD